jgi:uncharacterized protein
MISIDQARLLYDGAEAAHAFDHVLRVLALAERIAQAEGADLLIVRTATLLHDIARREPDHHRVGAERARMLLAGWPAQQVEAICHAIEAHRFRQGPAPATLEAACLHDADKLDAIGAIGVVRAVAYSASHGHRLWSQPLAEIDAGQPPPAGIDYTPSHEFVYKLAQIQDRLLTPTARRIASERHRTMVSFFQQLDAEATGAA